MRLVRAGSALCLGAALAVWAGRVLFAGAVCDLQQSQNFDAYLTAQAYTEDLVTQDFSVAKGPYKMVGNSVNSCLVKDGSLYGFYPKAAWAAKWVRKHAGKILAYNSGFSWYTLLPKPLLEATMDYDIYFQEGFDWTEGGKLPGMCGYDCPVGCSVTDSTRGWSTRIMWRKNGGIVTYAYYPDKPSAVRCGEDWQWAAGFESGKWYNIRIYNKMNSGPGVKDGIHRAYLNGQLVLEKTDIVFKYNTDDTFATTRAYFTSYTGGSTVSNFAPDHDQYIKCVLTFNELLS